MKQALVDCRTLPDCETAVLLPIALLAMWDLCCLFACTSRPVGLRCAAWGFNSRAANQNPKQRRMPSPLALPELLTQID
ncbi:hypothetical protein GOP47_0028602 [Adiantum capillus-veneris]|nr:hypothetical protein GOP47_0028602 [Adiantum capillus-veneris]